MKVEVCEDLEIVKEILFDDEMWDRCTDDYAVKDESILGRMGCLWMACYDNDQLLGIASVGHGSNSSVDVHIHIPKKNRGRQTRKMGLCFLKWIKDHAIQQVHKMNTKIPVIYPDVVRYAHSLGFVDEGVDTKSIMKNGELIDRICLGMSISEIDK